jgi:quinol monooxygenase YgiN
MSKIAVIAKITALEGKRPEVVAGLGPMLDNVESEEGTLLYQMLEDQVDENTIWMYELYTDQAAFDAHSSSEAMKALGHSLGGLLAGRPELFFTKPVGGKGL